MVIEVTSPSTEHVDRGEKMRIYAQVWRTAAYFIFDPAGERLDGYALDPARRAYVPLEPDALGDFAVAPMGLRLGVRPTKFWGFTRRFVRWIDSEGNPLPTGAERADAVQRRLDELERQRRLESNR